MKLKLSYYLKIKPTARMADQAQCTPYQRLHQSHTHPCSRSLTSSSPHPGFSSTFTLITSPPRTHRSPAPPRRTLHLRRLRPHLHGQGTEVSDCDALRSTHSNHIG